MLMEMLSSLNGPGKINLQVKDFANLSEGLLLVSPNFTLTTNSKVEFNLHCRPNYKCAILGYKCTMMYILLKSENQASVRYRISILNANGDKCDQHEGRAIFYLEPYDQRHHPVCQWNHDHLVNSANGLLVHGKLIIHFEVFEDDVKLAVGPFANNQICEDYESLLESGKFSDVALIVGGQELSVHKAILSARSKVFASMFEHDWKEKRQSRVEITDISVEVCKQMLRYIYSGKIAVVNEYTDELLVAADKYQLNQLKMACEQQLGNSLEIESAANTLLLADMHNATLIKPKTIDYIIEHSKEVIATDGWKHLAKTRPDLGILLFESCAHKK